MKAIILTIAALMIGLIVAISSPKKQTCQCGPECQCGPNCQCCHDDTP